MVSSCQARSSQPRSIKETIVVAGQKMPRHRLMTCDVGWAISPALPAFLQQLQVTCAQLELQGSDPCIMMKGLKMPGRPRVLEALAYTLVRGNPLLESHGFELTPCPEAPSLPV